MKKDVLIIQTGDSFGELMEKNMNFDEMIISKIKTKEYKVIKVHKGEKLPEYNDVDRVIITGSHSMVTDGESWTKYLSQWLIGLKESSIPVLGICYGHQLLAQTFNGVAGYHPVGPEIGMKEMKLTKHGKEDKLFRGIKENFYGYVTHSQSAIKLPKDAVILAYNSFEPHESFKIGECIYGVQFHPEFTADIIKVYVKQQKEKVQCFDKVYNNIRENDNGSKLFENFMNL